VCARARTRVQTQLPINPCNQPTEADFTVLLKQTFMVINWYNRVKIHG